MAGTLMDYTYKSTDGATTYTGQVVADTTNTKYNYAPGQTYAAPGGTYTIGTTPGRATNAPVGSVYQTSYTANGTSYDSYHYDPKSNNYYDVKTNGYDPMTGTYTPPAAPGAPASTPVPMWSSTNGLGSEYAYVKTTDGSYHVYGGGGNANAQITPSTVGVTAYDYQFMYPDGSYYDGKVIDDGTYGYKVGTPVKASNGTYNIYAKETAPPAASALAGYTYTSLYHDAATGTNYPPSDIMPASPYYQKPVGYGGLGTEKDYIQKPGGYYQFSQQAPASTATPVATLPLPS